MPEAYVLMGKCLDEADACEEAIEAYEKALILDKANLGVLYSKCCVMSKLGQFKEIQDAIKPWLFFGQVHENWEDLVALFLESSVALDSVQAALETLNAIIHKVGATENLNMNKKLLEAAC
ncbi:hypothetical protein JI58_04570 [Marinosulfonomonas sp. PRT-SC04]|nr:hypothetical protein JI58_04570 [Marinosulfonomonas sp. PRT-SC04]